MGKVQRRVDPRLLTVVLVTGVLVALVIGHASWLNGPAYWKWP